MEYKGIGSVQTISSGDVTASIDSFGAKVLSISVDGREILFYDENDIGHSGIPLCFPSFGPLNNGAFLSGGESYEMNQHGFIRDSEFEMQKDGEDTLVCHLSYSPQTLIRYPFLFDFVVTYKITENGLSIQFQFGNTGDAPLPLAPGVHPYFAVDDSTDVTFTTGAKSGNDNSDDYNEKTLDESGVFEIVDSADNGLALVGVNGTPDMHLIDHNLDQTLIGTGHERGIVMGASSELFNRMTIWRKDATVPYICVEPAYVQNGLNDDPVMVGAGEMLDTTVTIELNR